MHMLETIDVLSIGSGPAAISEAFAYQDFNFAGYRQWVISDPLLAELRIRRGLAWVV